MASREEQVSEQLFKIIKGFGHDIVLFTDDGQKTIEPTEARRFYAKDIQMMVNYTNDEATNEIVVNLSKGTDIKTVKKMLDAIRTMASRYLIEYTVKTFGKTISPKDFAFMAKQTTNESTQLEEGFSGWTGTARKSVNEIGDAKIIVRHKRSVDEEKRGARTRQIESIFIENSEGERFKFPNRNITAAKAMCRHVKEGGNPHDDFGQHIYSVMEELEQLKTFQRHNRRNNFFESEEEITEEINSRVAGLRRTLNQISGVKGYPAHFESFNKANGKEVSEEQINELKDAVTVQYFDERIAESLPYVARVIKEFRSRQDKEKEIQDFARYVLKHDDNFELNRPIDMDDPEAPMNQKFRDRAAEVSAVVTYLAPRVKDDTLSNMMMQVSDTVFEVGPKFVEIALITIRAIMRKAAVAESAQVTEKKSDFEVQNQKIEETFNKYSVKKLFG